MLQCNNQEPNMAQARTADRLTSVGEEPAVLRRGATSGQRPTIKDVARLAGVSAMTVSRVINRGSCSASSREAVERAISLLGYEPNIAARTLAASRASSGRRDASEAVQAGMPQALQAYSRMMLKLLQPVR
jgi:hypothetical protein